MCVLVCAPGPVDDIYMLILSILGLLFVHIVSLVALLWLSSNLLFVPGLLINQDGVLWSAFCLGSLNSLEVIPYFLFNIPPLFCSMLFLILSCVDLECMLSLL